MFDTLDRVKLVFVDGVFDAKASDDPRLAGVEIERLTEAGGRDSHWAQGLYGVLEARGQSPVERPLAALNSAFATDGVLIRVTGKREETDFPDLSPYIRDFRCDPAPLHQAGCRAQS